MIKKLLTEPEVAEILRCSASKVKRLRLAGKLGYVPGRPVLITEVDIEDYIQAERAASMKRPEPPMETKDDARSWALAAVHRRKR